MHFDADGSGAPRGNKNGNYKHGRYTEEMAAARRLATRGHTYAPRPEQAPRMTTADAGAHEVGTGQCRTFDRWRYRPAVVLTFGVVGDSAVDECPCQTIADRAIQDLDQAIRLDPNLAWAFNNRGLVYNAKGQYDRAIQDFDQAIKLNPNLAMAFKNRGVSYIAKGQTDRAIKDLDQAIKLNPNYADAFNNRGLAYNNKGQRDRAIQDLDQAIRLDQNFAYAYCVRGRVKRDQGDTTGGNTDIAKGKELNPNIGDWCG
jgi:predicted Zn-dependent protease